MTDGEPPDLSEFRAGLPGTPAQAAVAMHVMFSSLVGAGFTTWQALYLVAEMTRPRPYEHGQEVG